MEVTEESLRQRYSNLRTEELIEIERTSDLTELASRVIKEIFLERGVSQEQKASFIQESKKHDKDNISFEWWLIWAWLGLIPGNLLVLIELKDAIGLAIILIIFNSVLMILILKYNKYAFLIATVLTINPIIWIINGIYIKNRWRHPKVNNSPVNHDAIPE